MENYTIIMPFAPLVGGFFWSFIILAIIIGKTNLSKRACFYILICLDIYGLILYNLLIIIYLLHFNIKSGAGLLAGLIMLPLMTTLFLCINFIITISLYYVLAHDLEYDKETNTEKWPIIFKFKVLAVQISFHSFPIILFVYFVVNTKLILATPLLLIISISISFTIIIIFFPLATVSLTGAVRRWNRRLW